MVKNEQLLHFKHPNGELAMDGVVEKFTIKKGVSVSMTRKTKGDTLTYRKEVPIEVRISDPRDPYAIDRYAQERGCYSKLNRWEIRRAQATRINYQDIDLFYTVYPAPLPDDTNLIICKIVKGISYYYVEYFICREQDGGSDDTK